MKILAFAASLRTASFNRKLIQQAVTILHVVPDVEVDFADFRAFNMPLMSEREGI